MRQFGRKVDISARDSGGSAPRIPILFTILSLVFVIPAEATTYYVSQSGSDENSCAQAQDDTTQSNQKLTISAGIACLSAGDTLLIHAGTYVGDLNIINGDTYPVPSGTSISPITISAYPGGLAASTTPGPRADAEVVVLQPPDGSPAIVLNTTGTPSYLVFQDFIIDMGNNTTGGQFGGSAGIFDANGASNNTFLHLEVWNNQSDGIQMSADFITIQYCLIHNNGLDQNYANSGYGIYGGGNDNLVEGNDFSQNHGYGIQFDSASTGVNRNVFRKNKIHDNYPWNVAGGIGGISGGGLTIEGPPGQTDANKVYNNLVYHNGYGGDMTAGNGIQVYSYTTSTEVYDNTVYNNNGIGIFLGYYDASAPPIVRNNIVYSNREAPIVDAGDIQTQTPGTPVIDHNLSTDPSFVSVDATPGNPQDLHIQSGSAARNVGMTIATVADDYDGVTRPQEGNYDIGAYQYWGGP